MGVDVATFHKIFCDGFERIWDETLIPRRDVLSSSGAPRINRRSLDACGALGPILHYLNSTMFKLEVSLAQVFALVPLTVSHYISFTLRILLFTLRRVKMQL
jgi:hypothetical protein